ncbi:MAG: hypothetical protein KBE41_04265, partial [Lutibacter sp.]|nr:hypothetical protein [Lutibacter sp.]
MNGLQTNNAPHSSVVVPHFIFGAVSFFIVALMLVLSSSSVLEVYFNTKLIAITHMAILGWAIMIVFGALYQLIPVVFETALFSEKLAKVTFWMAAFSVLFLSYSFWVASFSVLLPYASVCMFVSLLLFVINVLLSYRKSEIKNWSSKFVIAAIIWLLLTELLGTLIALNFKFNFLSEAHIHYLKIHATIGFIGWFLLLIIGVGSTLIPMFLISHQLNFKKLKASFFLINSGLIGIAFNWFLINNSALLGLFWAFDRGIATMVSLGVAILYLIYKEKTHIISLLSFMLTIGYISILTDLFPIEYYYENVKFLMETSSNWSYNLNLTTVTLIIFALALNILTISVFMYHTIKINVFSTKNISLLLAFSVFSIFMIKMGINRA